MSADRDDLGHDERERAILARFEAAPAVPHSNTNWAEKVSTDPGDWTPHDADLAAQFEQLGNPFTREGDPA